MRRTLGDQDAALVPAMASRDTLPKPAAAAPAADVNVQFANAEAYVDKRDLRVAPGGAVTFSITNLDGDARHFSVRQLHNRSKIDAQGVLSWGAFDSDLLGAGVDVPAGETRTLTVTPAGDAFSQWIGDPNGGSQAGWAVALDRGPRKQSLEMGLGPVKPLHEALDSTGKLWVSLANTDQVARLTPTSSLIKAPAISSGEANVSPGAHAPRDDSAAFAGGRPRSASRTSTNLNTTANATPTAKLSAKTASLPLYLRMKSNRSDLLKSTPRSARASYKPGASER